MANTAARALGTVPTPADFPVGSLQSRAAARAILAALEKAQKPGILIRFVAARDGRVAYPNRECTCKKAAPGTIAFCECFL